MTTVQVSDLQNLARGGFGGTCQHIDNLANMPSSDPMWRAKSQQLLERHNLVRRANFINDSPDADTATVVSSKTTDVNMLTPSSTTAPAHAACFGPADTFGRFEESLETTDSTSSVAAAAATDLQQLNTDYVRQEAAATLAMGLPAQQFQWGDVCPTPFQDMELLLSSETHAGGWWADQDQWTSHA